MRSAKVFYNKILAGILIEESRKSYLFKYDEQYFHNTNNSSISLTMPKTKREYKSEHLFPFFYNMLSEGVNKKLQNRHLRIDENDYFGLLIETAQCDTIGPVTLKKIDNG